MATIKVSNLYPTGAELFSDSESYMNELHEVEQANVLGGGSSNWCEALSFAAVFGASGFACTISVGFFFTVAAPAY